MMHVAMLKKAGFDYGVAGTVTAFPAFQQDYGVPFPSQPSGYLIRASWQSAWSGASAAGNIVGVLMAGQLADLIGRKKTIGIGTVVTAAGIGIQVGSEGWRVFLVSACELILCSKSDRHRSAVSLTPSDSAMSSSAVQSGLERT
jgi:MFS family permease